MAFVDRLRPVRAGGASGSRPGTAGIGRRPVGAADDQREGVQHGRIGRRVARRLDRLGGGAGKALVGMQGHAPVLRRCEQGIGESLCRSPCRSEAGSQAD